MVLASLEDRSVNSSPIVGCETRIMMSAKKPISVSVTAPIAAKRAGPNRIRNWVSPFTAPNLCLAPAERHKDASLGKNFPVPG
jgi:hypothetical protein